MSKSFIKWVGGKKVILKTLIENLPETPIKHYFEPFLGGGALFFAIRYSHLMAAHCYLNDINKSLINTYEQVAFMSKYLIKDLEDFRYDKDEYYQTRELFSRDKNENTVFQAARFIYLNKCGFNGLYRENKKGNFNVPFGKYSKVNICDRETLLEASTALSWDVTLSSTSFNTLFEEHMKKNPLLVSGEGMFVYFDPPYYKEVGNSFTSYTSYDFSKEDHILLRNVVDFLSCFGASIMLSNSDTEFVRELYKDYKIIEVVSRRSINRDGNNRKPKTELLIKNY